MSNPAAFPEAPPIRKAFRHIARTLMCVGGWLFLIASAQAQTASVVEWTFLSGTVYSANASTKNAQVTQATVPMSTLGVTMASSGTNPNFQLNSTVWSTTGATVGTAGVPAAGYWTAAANSATAVAPVTGDKVLYFNITPSATAALDLSALKLSFDATRSISTSPTSARAYIVWTDAGASKRRYTTTAVTLSGTTLANKVLDLGGAASSGDTFPVNPGGYAFHIELELVGATASGSGVLLDNVKLLATAMQADGCAIGNLVYNDVDLNGFYNTAGGDTAVSGAVVDLLDSAGTVLKSTTTTATGQYFFTNLLPSGPTAPATPSYKVRVNASSFASGQPLFGKYSILPASPVDGTTGDDNVPGNDAGVDDNNPATNGISSHPIVLTAGTEPTLEAGALNTLDDAYDSNGDLTVDFGFRTTPTTDFGDNPSFPAASNIISSALKIGTNATDGEATNPVSGTATLDDTSGSTPDDEDLDVTTKTFTAGSSLTYAFSVTAGAPAKLMVWADWNNDGAVTGTNEIVTATALDIIAGTNSYSVIFNPPAGTIGICYLRFRVQDGATSPTFSGSSTAFGEVEDYAVNVVGPTLDFGDWNSAGAMTTTTSSTVNTNLRLGATVDTEFSVTPDPAATADGADEDGVTMPASIGAGASVTIPVSVFNNSGLNGYLNAWIDFNNDGTFNDTLVSSGGERLEAARTIATGVSATTQNITFTVPAGASIGTQRGVRFRLTDQATTAPTGAVGSGEVEDYVVSIITPPSFPELCSPNVYSWTALATGGTFSMSAIDSAVMGGKTGVTSGVSCAFTNSAIQGQFIVHAPLTGSLGTADNLRGIGGTALSPVYQDLSADLAQAVALSNKIAALTPTQTLGSFTTPFTVNATAVDGKNVILITDVYLGGSEKFTLNGGPSDYMIVNIQKRLSFTASAGIELTGGLQPPHVMVNLLPGSTVLQLTGSSTATGGTFIALNSTTVTQIIGSAVINGAVFAKDMGITGGSIIKSGYAIDCGVSADFGDWNGSGAQTTTASSTMNPNLRLGVSVDAEASVVPDAGATADGADEDGVTMPGSITAGMSVTIPVSFFNNNTSGTYLQAWIDFDNNGTFNDVDLTTAGGERIYNAVTPASASQQMINVTFTVPATASAGTQRGVRFRLSDNAATTPTSSGATGEIEDYTITINAMALGGLVYEDKNFNGQYDSATDAVINGATVTLYKDLTGNGITADDVVTPFTQSGLTNPVTPAGSVYSFANLPPGNYFVKITPASGTWYIGGSPISTNPVLASKLNNKNYGNLNALDATAFFSPVLALTLGGQPGVAVDGDDANTDSTIDFGLFKGFTVGDLVFEDVNNNGTLDVGDIGISGVAVDLLDGTTSSVQASTTTDLNGNYSLVVKAPGTYKVRVTPPPGDPLVSSVVGTDNGTNNNNDGTQPGGVGTAVTSFTFTLANATEPGTAGLTNIENTIDFGLRPALTDFGDYPNFASASQYGSPDIRIGANATDTEAANPTTGLANADDTSGNNDEDLVLPVVGIGSVTKYTFPVTLSGTATSATIAAWADWNGDNLVTGTNEVLTVTPSTLVAGVNTVTVTFNPPSGTTVGTKYLRFRVAEGSTAPTFSGASTARGEVEDYAITASLPTFDFGDYTNFGDAWSTASATTKLGATVDVELVANKNGAATGDDLNYTDDEDGVTFGTFTPGASATINVSCTSTPAAYLNVWIDWNENGVLTDAGEQVATNMAVAANSSGVVKTITVNVPATARGTIPVRVRLNTISGTTSTGLGLGVGEVEDHIVTIASTCQSQLAIYDAIILNNLSTPSDIEGRTVVKNITGTNSFTMALMLAAPATEIDVAVQTSVAAGGAINLQSGSFYAPSSAALNGRVVNYNGGGSLVTSPAFDFATVFNGIISESATYAAMATNSTIAIPSSPSPTVLTVGSGVTNGTPAVFSIDGQTLFHNNNVQTLDLNLNGKTPSAIIINVTGTTIAYDWSGGMIGTLAGTTWRPKILWNFPTATSITCSKNLYGCMMAPNATFTSNGGANEGAIAVKDYLGTFEVHLPLWTGGSSICTDASDYGDYLGFADASSTAVTNIKMGTNAPDVDAAGLANATATGDDTNGIDDEDGVTFGLLPQNGTGSLTVNVTNTSGAPAYLNGWIDWDNNGILVSGEQVVANVSVASGTSNSNLTYTFTVPATAALGQHGARFRLTSTSNPGPTDYSGNGEVEDYLPTVSGPNIDYGDYALFADASSIIGTTIKLGSIAPDGELAAVKDSAATGDDNNGVDDEDGVALPAVMLQGTSSNITVNVNNTSGAAAYLNGWFDWNGNGSFDAGELMINNISYPNGTAGNQVISIAVPAGATLGTIGARFRLTASSAPGFTGTSGVGTAGVGEVEDYTVTIGSPIGVSGLVYEDKNFNGQYDSGTDTVINGATVTLYKDLTGNGITADDTVFAQSGLTNPVTLVGSVYSFTNLPAGSYFVKVKPASGTWYQSSSPIATNPLVAAKLDNKNYANLNALDTTAFYSPVLALTVGGQAAAGIDGDDANTDSTIDFGIWQRMSIGNLVFNDSNNDGSAVSEAGIGSVTVELFKSTDAIVGNGDDVSQGTTTTAAGTGAYGFSGMLPGNYFLKVTPTGTYQLKSGVSASDNGIDNDNNATTQASQGQPIYTHMITLAAGTEPGSAGTTNTDNTIDIGLRACPAIIITPASLAAATQWSTYSQTITGSGGTGTITLTQSGSLPSGLTWSGGSGTATISGTPIVTGTFPITVTGTDPTLCTATINYSIVVNACGAITINPASSLTATLGTAHNTTFSATGGSSSYTWTMLPAPLSGLVSWWPAENSSMDFGGTNHGVQLNGVTFPAGKLGNAFGFDGVDDNISIADAATLKPANITLEAWVNASAAQSANASVFMKTTSSAMTDGYGLGYVSATQFGFWVNSTAAASRVVTSSALSTGAWHHVVGTYDGTTIRLYVDGAQVGTGTTYSTAITHTTQPLVIGRAAGGNDWLGQIDEPAIYNRALTAAEVTTRYNSGNTISSVLPNGITWNAATPAISGTPAAPATAGTYLFTILARDTNNCLGRKDYSLNLSCPSINLSGTLNTAYRGVNFTTGNTLTASAGTGNYAWTVTGLPAGLTYSGGGTNNATLTITGTTTAAIGNYPLTVTATDGSGCSGTLNPTLVLKGLGIGSLVYEDKNYNGVYDSGVDAVIVGATVSLYADSGSAGIDGADVLVSQTGVTATTSTNASGVYSFAGLTPGSYFVKVKPASGTWYQGNGPVVLNPAVGSKLDNKNYANLNAVDSTAFFSPVLALTVGGQAASGIDGDDVDTDSTIDFGIWQRISLGNLVFNDADNNGSLNGAETGIGSVGIELFKSTDTVVGNGDDVSQTTTISAAVTGAYGFSGLLPGNYFLKVTPTGTYQLKSSVSGSDNGVDNDNNGISQVSQGQPIYTHMITLTANGEPGTGGTGNVENTIDIGLRACPTINITPATLAGGTQWAPYSQTITGSGTGTISLAITAGTLPSGLTWSGGSGTATISGTPTVTGSFPITVTGTDPTLCTATINYTIVVNACGAITINPASSLTATLGTAHNTGFSATGGSGSYTWTMLPAPLSGLVSWWPGENSSMDFAGTNHGVQLNGVTFPAGKLGNAFGFDGVDDNIAIADAATLKPANITLEAWVNPSAAQSANAAVFMKTTSSAMTDGYGLGYLSATQFGFWVNSTAAASSVVTSTALSTGAWHHVVGTYDGTTIRLYVDGAQVGTGTAYSTAIAHTTQPLVIGRAAGGNDWLGQIDEPAIYNRALSAAEVTTRYNSGNTISSVLPNGITWNAATPAISGTPAAPATAGTYLFTILARDTNNCLGRKDYSLNLSCPSINLAGTLSTPYRGVNFTTGNTLTASAGTGNYAWTVTGLPAGLTYSGGGTNNATLTITGTTTAATGNYPLTVTATEGSGCSGTLNPTLVLKGLGIGSLVYEDKNYNGVYDSGVDAVIVGATVSLYADSGSAGIDGADVLVSQTGVTATTSTNASGVYSFAGLTPGSYFVKVKPASGTWYQGNGPVVLNPAVGSKLDNKNYANLNAVDSTAFFSPVLALTVGGQAASGIDGDDVDTDSTIDFGIWQRISLGNLVFNDADNNGSLNGAETGIGSVGIELFKSTDTVVGNGDDVSQTTTISAAVTGAYGFSGLLPGNYFLKVTPTGTYQLKSSVSGSDNGVDNDNNGISQVSQGQPIYTHMITLTANGEPGTGGTGNVENTIDIGLRACPTINITPATLAGGTQWAPYSQTITGSGTGTISLAITAGTLPSGLTWSGGSGTATISGTPTVTGSFPITVTGTDPTLCTATINYTIVVNACGAITINPASSLTATLGTAHNTGFSATGGSGSYTWTMLPAPLSGLVSWWPGENSSMDFAGTNHGVQLNGVTFPAGKLGNAFGFDGVDDNIAIADAATLKPANITLEAWVNPSAAQSANAAVFMKTTSSAMTDGYGLGYLSATQFGFWVNSTAAASSVVTSTALSTGAWHHVVGTYDGTTIRLYVDGAQVGTGTAYSTAITHTTQPLVIGRAAGGNDWLGQIDEPAIYNRALSAAEVTTRYNSGNAISSVLPNGITWNAATPAISGTPTAPATAGTYLFTILARDTNNCLGRKDYSLNMSCPSINLAGTLSTPYRGVNFTTGNTLTASAGTGNYAWTVTGLPAGLTYSGGGTNNATLTITGTTTAATGNYPLTVTATEGSGCSGTLNPTLVLKGLGIGSLVYEDKNYNGVYDSGVDAVIVGATVSLYADSGSAGIDGADVLVSQTGVTATTSTNASGVYSFAGLTPGSYFVKVKPASGTWYQGGSPIATNPLVAGKLDNKNYGNLSVVDNTAFFSPVLALTVGGQAASGIDGDDADTDSTIDFGLWQRMSLGNLVFNDADNNGSLNGVETGINGVTVELFKSTDTVVGNGDDVSQGTTTTSTISTVAGTYGFSGMLPGNYFLKITPTATYQLKSSGVGTDNGVNNDNNGVTQNAQGQPIYTHMITMTANSEPGVTVGGGNAENTIDIGLRPCDPITVAPAVLATAVYPSSYSQTFTASGSTATPYTFMVSAGALPTWATLDSATGILSGTPDSTATANFTIRATDALLCYGERAYTLTPVDCFVVTNTNNSGIGSLRDAINCANARPGADTITFAIPGVGVKTITLLSSLPNITGPVSIDGYTQSGSAANTLATGNNAVPLIEVNGATFVGFNFNAAAPGSTLKGLIINNCSVGVVVAASNCTVQGNFIGTNATGIAATANGTGITVSGATGTLIGGTTPAARNVISGNTLHGVELVSSATGTLIQGNYIGTNATGTAAVPNAGRGIDMTSAANNNTVGGTAAGAGNVVSGNGWDGIRIQTTGNNIQGNIIGLNAAGTAAIGNGYSGIEIQNSSNTIGGAAVTARNVISGGTGAGVSISSGSSNSVQGNYLGLNAAGSGLLGNATFGITVTSASNTIGGVNPGEENSIAGNGTAFSSGGGIYIGGPAALNVAVRRNSIYDNLGLGLDIGNIMGLSPNDGSVNAGEANKSMDYPVITSVSLSGSNLSVAGYIGNLTAGTSAFAGATVEIFAADNSPADQDGEVHQGDLLSVSHGEGRLYLGTLTADGSSLFGGTLALTAPQLAAWTAYLGSAPTSASLVTATAIDATGNTSEFGPISLPYDFGDWAHATNPSGAATTTTKSLVTNTIRLGATVDSEHSVVPNVTATADGADEDGVTMPASITQGASTTITVTVNNSSGSPAYLNAWIDFNNDGVFNDTVFNQSTAPTGERLELARVIASGTTTATPQVITFNVPTGASVGTQRGVRFRLTNVAATAPTGNVGSGEVEDYIVTINTAMSIGNLVWNDTNGNGLFDGTEIGIGGVQVDLYTSADGVAGNGDDVFIATTTTNSSGIYSFTNRAPGQYVVRVTPPSGFPLTSGPVVTADNQINNDNNGTQVGLQGTLIYSPVITLAAGTESITDGDSDANTELTVDFALKACGTIAITPATLPSGNVNSTYLQSLTASGGNGSYFFSQISGTMAPGLSLNSSGVVTGTPTTAGTFTFTAQAVDTLGCIGTQAVAVTIRPLPVICCLAKDEFGRYYVGGSFYEVNGTARTNLARLSRDGSVDTTFTPGAPNGPVYALSYRSGTLYVGGGFTNWGGSAQNLLVKLDATGTRDTNFAGNILSGNSGDAVYAISDNGFYVSGKFSGTRNGVAALDPSTSALVTGFNPAGPGAGSIVYDLLYDGTRIVTVGDFTTFNGASRRGIAALSTTGTTDANWPLAAVANNTARSLMQVPTLTDLIAAGDFSNFNGASGLKGTARFSNTTGTATAGYGVGGTIPLTVNKINKVKAP